MPTTQTTDEIAATSLAVRAESRAAAERRLSASRAASSKTMPPVQRGWLGAGSAKYA